MTIFNCYVSSPEGKQKVGGLMELITKTELNRVLLCVNCIWRITPLKKYLMICPHGILGRSPSLVGFYPKKKGHNFHLRVLTSQTILILSSMSFNRFPRISHYKPPRKLAKILAQDVRAPPPPEPPGSSLLGASASWKQSWGAWGNAWTNRTQGSAVIALNTCNGLVQPHLSSFQWYLFTSVAGVISQL